MLSFKNKLIDWCINAFGALMLIGLFIVLYAVILSGMEFISDSTLKSIVISGLGVMAISSIPAFTVLGIAIIAIVKPVYVFIKARLVNKEGT